MQGHYAQGKWQERGCAMLKQTTYIWYLLNTSMSVEALATWMCPVLAITTSMLCTWNELLVGRSSCAQKTVVTFNGRRCSPGCTMKTQLEAGCWPETHHHVPPWKKSTSVTTISSSIWTIWKNTRHYIEIKITQKNLVMPLCVELLIKDYKQMPWQQVTCK